MNVLLALIGLAAIAAVAMEYGFRGSPPIALGYLRLTQGLIVAFFVLDRFVRLIIAPKRRAFLRENWIDFALMAIAATALGVTYRMHLHGKVLSLSALYVIIMQAYILVSLVLRAVSLNLHFAGSGISPAWLLIGSFATLSLVGSGLLMLPAATPAETNAGYRHIYYIDALFTATSATCVTGLIVRDTGLNFTPFGQAVILALIQLGGLGIMIFGTLLAMLVGKGLTIRGSQALGEMVASEEIGRLGRIIKFVVLVTLVFEIVGAALFYSMFASSANSAGEGLSTAKAVWYSIFHSISSFCNAGFSLYSNNMAHGVAEGWSRPLRNHWQVMGVMAPLIVLGGLGFPVLRDCAGYLRSALARLRSRNHWTRPTVSRPRLSLHSKIMLSTSLLLIVAGAVVLITIEPIDTDKNVIGRHPLTDARVSRRGDWQQMNTLQKTRHAIFQSITARTAGFNTFDMKELSDAGKLWLCGLMVVGGSPASTAGGMKTATVALLALTAYCIIRRRRELEVFGRSISAELLRKTVTLAVLYLGLVATITMLLCIVMRPGYQFIDLLFEACSACGTVGLSTGVTRQLNLPGKHVIIAGMFIGRIGPLTLLLAATSRIKRVRYSYPTENVVIG